MPFFKKSKNKKENSAAAPPPAPADTSSEITPDKETDSRESGVCADSSPGAAKPSGRTPAGSGIHPKPSS